jgi:hypothetical protein
VPKNMINLNEMMGSIEYERSKSVIPTHSNVPHGKRFNANAYLSTTEIELIREAKECTFEPKLRSKSRSQTRADSMPPVPKGFDTMVQRMRIGY